MIKKILKIGLPILLLTVICAGAVFAICSYQPYNLDAIQKDPATQLSRSLSRTKAALQDGLAFTVPDTVKAATKDGAIQLDLFTEDKQHITGKLFMSGDNYALTGSIPSDTDALEFGLWATQEALVVNVPTLLNDTAYGISLKTLKEDAANSELWEALGISYDDIAPILEMLEPAEAEEQNPLSLLKLKKKWDAMVNTWSVSVAEKTVVLDTEQVPVYQISYTLSPDHICQIIDLVSEYAAQMDIAGIDKENLAQHQQMMTDCKNQVTDSEATAIIDIYLHGKTQVIVQANCRIDWFENYNPATVNASICLGAEPAESAQYSFVVNTTLPGHPKSTFRVDYRRTHAHNLPGRELTITADSETYTVMSLQVNEVNQSFALELLDGKANITGYWQQSEKKTVIHTTFAGLGELSLTFLPDVKMPELPQYTNLLTLDKAALNALFGGSETPPAPKDKAIDIAITSTDGTRKIFYFMHNYTSLGELLTEEGIAILDVTNGSIVSICDEDISGASWSIYVDGEPYTGDLFELILENETAVAILPIEN